MSLFGRNKVSRSLNSKHQSRLWVEHLETRELMAANLNPIAVVAPPPKVMDAAKIQIVNKEVIETKAATPVKEQKADVPAVVTPAKAAETPKAAAPMTAVPAAPVPATVNAGKKSEQVSDQKNPAADAKAPAQSPASSDKEQADKQEAKQPSQYAKSESDTQSKDKDSQESSSQTPVLTGKDFEYANKRVLEDIKNDPRLLKDPKALAELYARYLAERNAKIIISKLGDKTGVILPPELYDKVIDAIGAISDPANPDSWKTVWDQVVTIGTAVGEGVKTIETQREMDEWVKNELANQQNGSGIPEWVRNGGKTPTGDDTPNPTGNQTQPSTTPPKTRGGSGGRRGSTPIGGGTGSTATGGWGTTGNGFHDDHSNDWQYHNEPSGNTGGGNGGPSQQDRQAGQPDKEPKGSSNGNTGSQGSQGDSQAQGDKETAKVANGGKPASSNGEPVVDGEHPGIVYDKDLPPGGPTPPPPPPPPPPAEHTGENIPADPDFAAAHATGHLSQEEVFGLKDAKSGGLTLPGENGGTSTWGHLVAGAQFTAANKDFGVRYSSNPNPDGQTGDAGDGERQPTQFQKLPDPVGPMASALASSSATAFSGDAHAAAMNLYLNGATAW